MLDHVKNTLVATALLLVVTTAAYPLIVTGIGQAAFPHQVNGSLVHDAHGNVVGSELLAQDFNGTAYFHPRPSAVAFNAAGSGGSNLGPSNPALAERVNGTLAILRASGDLNPDGSAPVDAVTASGSGLDPHITLANALAQVPRVAQARNLDPGVVRGLVNANTDERGLLILGEPGVNVLKLNLALDRGDTAPSTSPQALNRGDAQWYGAAAAVVLGVAILVGSWLMSRLMTRTMGPVERKDPPERKWWQVWRQGPEMNWKQYAAAFLVFNFFGILLTFLTLVFQDKLPLNPQHLPGVPWELALNTAVSFGTNTNWQAYAGEATMSNFSQMVGLTFHNFASAAVGIAAAFALIRGIARRDLKNGLGNFWTDLWRVTLFVLLPIALVFAVFLMWQGVPQTLGAPVLAHTLQGGEQTIVLGPVASQEAIKMFGTNGGGFYNANSAHPFENPTALSNFVETLSMIVASGGLLFTFGRAILKPKHGRALFIVCALVLTAAIALTVTAEQHGNPLLAGLDQAHSALQAGGNMEGKEVRFGIFASGEWAGITTATSDGAVNSMHDSYMPLSGMWPLVLIMLGELIFGGVGAGLYSLVVMVVVSLFIAGLMTGRTPEYAQKKIGTFDIKMVMLSMLAAEVPILIGSAIAISLATGRASIANPGAHGLTEVLYAYSSAVGNNGSAFAGLNANTLWYNLSLAAAMLVGRFAYVVPVFALAGSMAPKQTRPETVATFPITGALFGGLLIGVIFIVTALTFFPALVLGPILEHVKHFFGGV